MSDRPVSHRLSFAHGSPDVSSIIIAAMTLSGIFALLLIFASGPSSAQEEVETRVTTRKVTKELNRPPKLRLRKRERMRRTLLRETRIEAAFLRTDEKRTCCVVAE